LITRVAHARATLAAVPSTRAADVRSWSKAQKNRAVDRSGSAVKSRNEVFPLEIRTDNIVRINDALKNHQLAMVVHLAEGKRNDASSEREFRMLRARGFLQEGLSIIHGVALRAPDVLSH